MEPGKLYRVNDYAVSNEARWAPQNHMLVQEHGWLWVWDGSRTQAGDHMLRSVATGDLHLWLRDELEAADD